MAKILAKYARRNNSDELPDRRELVEMDLFDTDRNPWPGKLGGSGLWERYDFDPDPSSYNPVVVPSGSNPSPLITRQLEIKRSSFVIAFVDSVYNLEYGAGDGKTLSISLDISGDGGAVHVQADKPLDALGGTLNIGGYDSWSPGVLNPATYSVVFRNWITNEASPTPSVTVADVAATVLVLPAGLAALGSGWGGTGG